MNLLVDPKTNNKGESLDTLSEYKPNKKERERFSQLIGDLTLADSIMNNSYEEFGSLASLPEPNSS